MLFLARWLSPPWWWRWYVPVKRLSYQQPQVSCPRRRRCSWWRETRDVRNQFDAGSSLAAPSAVSVLPRQERRVHLRTREQLA
jgi:hypothetical protein